ncbi:MAG: protein kinase [Myxococcaceae bacterium]|nr:protein kinase [Myxococcaceae bacterium]
MRAAEADDYIGRVIKGKYRVEDMIGEGGMGKVYKARQVMLDKPVVLKVLRQSLLSDERTVQRFQREAKAASRLQHPNSISIVDFDQAEDGALYIAMEYVQGKDLHQILSREWPLPEARVVRIVSQVLSALAEAHSAGVIHRDLKPENIMVEQRRNEPDFVKVLDFGIAKIQDATGDEGPALTRAGFVCGTPEYMSPEQARGAPLDHRSDLYAVGVILYQLMTGLLPFESDSAVGFATKHLTEEPPPPSRRRPEAKISPGMERLILKALSKDPNDRPQTAEQFRAELIAIDKERRSAAQRRPGISSPVLSPIPRKVTPADQLETRVDPRANPWSASEATVRQDAVVITAAGGAATATHTDGVEAASAGLLAFKIVTVLLVAISVGLAGWYLYGLYFGENAPLADTLSSNAPVPRESQDPVTIQPTDTRPLYEREIVRNEAMHPKAEALARDADRAVRNGKLDIALAHYQEAYEKYPDPEYALKLGELYYQRNDMKIARAWWERHLALKPESKARAYIQERLTSM